MVYDCLVIGGDSPIGSAIFCDLQRVPGVSVAKTTRRDETRGSTYNLDLEELGNLGDLPRAKNLIMVAAVTNMVVCETEKIKTQNINVFAQLRIAEWAERIGARVIFLSSIAVFGETQVNVDEGVEPCPSNIYGQQKFQAEAGIAAITKNFVVLRMGKVLTQKFPLFEQWIDCLESNVEIHPFSDLYTAPVYQSHVVEVIRKVVNCQTANGIFHLTACESASYDQIACWIAQALALDERLIQPKAAHSNGNQLVWKPKVAHLDCLRLATFLNKKMPTPKEMVEKYLFAR